MWIIVGKYHVVFLAVNMFIIIIFIIVGEIYAILFMCCNFIVAVIDCLV